MASPQLENGYTRIANEILEALSKIPLSGSEFRLAIAILRYTYGMQQKSAEIKTQTLRNTTNLISSRLSEAKKKLIKRGIVFVTKKRNRVNATYEFNKNYTQWNSLRKNVTLRKNVKHVTEKRNSGGAIPIIVKEIVKDRATMKNNLKFSKKVPLPVNIFLTEEMKDYAEKKRWTENVETEFERFVSYHSANGSKFKDWYAAFQKWIQNDIKWHPENQEQKLVRL